MAYDYRCPKRYDDLNAGGHIDHAVIIDYLQEARVEFLLSAPEPMASMLDSGVLVTAHRIEYLAPIGYTEPHLGIRLWIDHVGAAQFTISYRLTDGDREVVRARTSLASYDLDGGSLRRLTAAERDQLTAEHEPAQSLSSLDRVDLADLVEAHVSRCRVRWADLDSYGHVNNVRFFDYFSQARMELIGGVGGDGGVGGVDPDPVGLGERWLVVRQDLVYRLPIDFRRDPYLVRTVVNRIGRTSCEFSADIIAGIDHRTSFATARTVMVQVDSDGRPEPMGSRTRKILEAYAK